MITADRAGERIPLKTLHDLGTDILNRHGVPDHIADSVLRVLITAEARGYGSHGLIRLPRIVKGLVAGTHHASAEPEWLAADTYLSVNCHHGLGPYCAEKITDKAIAIAQRKGLCLAVARNMTHFGTAGYFCERAASVGLIGITLCNTEPAATAFGAHGKLLGTNPIAFSCPRKDHPPISLDMATTAVARGKILETKAQNKLLPEYVAVDRNGNMTTDPAEALEGALLPLGGLFAYKGAGLALMVDILAGALSGSSTGSRVKGTVTTTDECSAGYFFLFIDPAILSGSRARFENEVELLAEEIKSSGGRIPGERAHEQELTSRAEGILLPQELLAQLVNLAQQEPSRRSPL